MKEILKFFIFAIYTYNFSTKADCQPLLIFSENFDNTPDWVSSDESDIPLGWTAVYANKRWSPKNGHIDKHFGQEILASNASFAKGGKGKSWVTWRESHNPGWLEWNSDNMLSKIFDNDYKDLHITFYVRFNENWRGLDTTSKIFRVFHWNGDKQKLWSGFAGGLGPMLLWDYSYNNYGLRNLIALRGGPPGSNYAFKNNDIDGLPRQMAGLGDLSLNFTNNTKGIMLDGSDPKIYSKKTNTVLPKDGYIVEHQDIFGDGWSKIEFYVKMNSEADAKDGVLMQWIDNSLVFNNQKIPWIRKSENNKIIGWNGFSIGGNDFFQTISNSEKFEEWYSIDDISVYTNIPEWFIEMKSSNLQVK